MVSPTPNDEDEDPKAKFVPFSCALLGMLEVGLMKTELEETCFKVESNGEELELLYKPVA